MIRNEIFGWLLKFWIIAVIGFILFCIGRYFNHFPKHGEKQVGVILPAEVEVYEAVKTAGNSYEILRRVKAKLTKEQKHILEQL